MSSWSDSLTVGRVVRLGHREVGPDALADHARLARGDVRPGRGIDGQGLAGVGADALDLAEDPQPVLGQQVELGHLVAVVGHREGERPGGSLGGRHVARVVGRADGEGARVALLAGLGAVGAAGGEHQGGGSGSGERAQWRDSTLHDRDPSVGAAAGAGAGCGVGTTVEGEQVEGDRRYDVRRPDDRLEHGRRRGDVEHPAEHRAVPGVGVERRRRCRRGCRRGPAAGRSPGGRGRRTRGRRQPRG